MTTSLAAQLAHISAQSKSTLDVKAQKAAHSKSLIFEPRVATGQSFQTIFALCHEGFEELCQIDGRLSQFSSTLFSEQSQDEDRTQMTAAENAELDKQIEAFLQLSASRLRLLPAIKSIEWLIRRFRIHEFNTSALITTFLPYHSIPTFVTLMSILPSSVPHEYRFLNPYIRSLTAPPRATIVHQATNHPELLSAISQNVLRSCRAQQHYPALITFWGGIMTEAVNGMIHKQRSGRKGVQLEHDQALLQQIGPTLAETLVMKDAPALQIASYMVITLLASKGSLNDAALSAFMEHLVGGWAPETVRPGVVCLSILAQYRSAKQLSSKITKALLKVQSLPQILSEIGRERPIDRLANGYVLALTNRLVKKGAARGLPTIKSILLSDVLHETQRAVAFKALLVAAHDITADIDADGDIRKQLGSCLVILSQEPGSAGDTIRKVIGEVDFDIEELELKLDASIRPRRLLGPPPNDPSAHEAVDPPHSPEDLDTAMERLSSLESPDSCLSQGSDTLFEPLCELLLRAASDRTELVKFDTAPLLHRAEAALKCFYLSFYMRVWTGPYPTLARVAALEMAKGRLELDDCSGFDFQAVLPYCVAALGDPAAKVRLAAASLLAVLGSLSKRSDSESSSRPSWGFEQLYEKLDSPSWLNSEASNCLLQAVILPSLEESVLHEGYMSEVLRNALDSSNKPAKTTHISHGVRLSIMRFLAGHTIYTPQLSLKIRLLKILNQVRGVSGTSRTQLLLPLLRWWASLDAPEAQQLAWRESLDEATMDSSCVDIVIPNDVAGLDCFFEISQGSASQNRPALIRCIFARIRKIWPSMKSETRVTVAQKMLAYAQSQVSPSDARFVVSEEAAELLRNVDLSTNILSDFLGSLQDSINMAADWQPNKRRRMSSSTRDRGTSVTSTPDLASILSKITFVLQLIEGSNPAEHPELLPDLFTMLSDLLTLKSLTGSEFGYLQNLVLASLLAMMPAYRNSTTLKMDTSLGHGDVLVTCIQKSSSPAVQNAALLLVASLAQTAPDLILHCVIPIFTFMGGPALRQSDDYSAHVVKQTIKEVVPPLIETFRKKRRNIVASAAELLSSFVVAYEHIPSHRKHDLFISLIENLGPGDFLFAVVAMFADKYGTTDSITTFLLELMNSFTAEVQLQSLVAMVGLIADIFKPKPALSPILLGKNEDGEQDLQKSAMKELTMLPRLLSNRKLKEEIGKLAGNDDMEAARVRELYTTLLEDILTLAGTVKTRKPLQSRCGEALGNLLNLLSIGEFIKAVETLLDRPDVGIRQKVLRALEVRVDSEKTSDPASRTALLAFLPQLTAVIRDSDMSYKHTAIICVDKIAEKYGKKDIEAVTAAASTIASDHCLGEADRRLRIMALLCLASLADVLQDAIVPVLPVAIPKSLQYLKESLNGLDSDAELHNAVYSWIRALAQYLPYMISGSYLDELLRCSAISAEAKLDDDSNECRLHCLHLLAKQVDAKVLFATLQKNWPVARQAGYSAIDEYLQILDAAIDKHPKATIAKNIDPLSAIFQSILDLRREEQVKESVNGSASATALLRLVELEGKVNEVALKLIYKLNDAAFRPVFSQIMEWSAAKLPGQDVLGRTLRQQSVYGFLLVFFDNLKSIVTSYASYVLDSAAGILTGIDMKKSEDGDLWKMVLKTLAKCFEHDQDDFWQAPSHFDAIAPVLIGQFAHAAALDISEVLVPAVVGLAGAADSQEHQKELNGAILKHLRSESATVRLAAVKCEQALTDSLGEEWLAMLPEMLPYISELQQDDDEVVDRETHRWIGKIEAVLGESLDSMLQ